MSVGWGDLSPKARKQAKALLEAGGICTPGPTTTRRGTVRLGGDGRSDLEVALGRQIKMAGLPDPVEQHKFCPGRAFRFDGAWPWLKIAYEVDGATWSGGRHVRGEGVETDALKYSQAAVLGWRVMRFTARMVEDGTALKLIEQALKGEQK